MKKEKHAKHFDTGKPKISLIPYIALEEAAKAFGYGETKYGKYNFKKGMYYSKLVDSALRHILKFKEGEDFDEESKTVTHIGHAIANLAMLLDVYKRKPELDDRYKSSTPNKNKRRKKR